MSFIISSLVAAVILFGPILSVIALVRWGRQLTAGGTPRTITRAIYACAAVVGFIALSGYAWALFGARSLGSNAAGSSQKARALAEGISEVMNSSALALLIAGVGAAGLTIWVRRS